MAVKKATAKVLSNLDAGVLEKYLKDISVYPRLSAEEEREYGRIVQNTEANDEERSRAADALVNGTLHFVVSYAKKRSRTTDASLLDLINEGNIGLMHAARRFDPERGVRFITYAVFWVRQAISHALSEEGGAIRLPQKQVALQARLSRKREELSQKLGRDPTIQEIARESEIGIEDAESLLSFSNTVESLEESLGTDQESALEDLPVQTTFADADDELVKRSSEEQTRGLLDNLPAKERAVLCRRFGISENGGPEREPMTLQEIGDELMLTRERVRQIEAQAIARIKRTINQRKLHASLN